MTHKMLNHPVSSILDIVVSSVVVMSSTAITLLLAEVAPYSIEELQLLLVPFLGALTASSGMIMLNPTPETRRIVIGRAVFALFLGTITPQIFGLVFTSYAAFLAHPTVLLGAGGVGAMFFYALSRPFTEGMYRKSRATADMILRKGQDALVGTVRENVREIMNEVVSEKVAPVINERADAIERKQETKK